MKPLADLLRPQRLEDIIGQRHLIAEGCPLYQMVYEQAFHSMILWGPPGVGKTTFARLLSRRDGWQFIALSAVLDGVQQVRQAVRRAEDHNHSLLGRETVLFVDEVHRFNKAQQDAFLPHIENGTVIFIGATTENPAFELNNALLSRCRVYALQPLGYDDLKQLLDRCKHYLQRSRSAAVDFLCVEELLIGHAQGDGRRLLNTVEVIVRNCPEGADVRPTPADVRKAADTYVHHFDKRGDHWYDMISAVHKSVRGSDPDAGLYWYVRMIESGCDPLYIARRLLAIASEDIGNADPRALLMAEAAWQSYARLGKAEGERAIAHAIVYLACAPKSNSVDTALKQARETVRSHADYPVPHHLRNAPTELAKSMGYGKQYRFPHDEPFAHAAGQSYLPEELAACRFYVPSDRGMEKQIAEKLDWIRRRNSDSQQ